MVKEGGEGRGGRGRESRNAQIQSWQAYTRVEKNYSNPIWSRVLALLELLDTAVLLETSRHSCCKQKRMITIYMRRNAIIQYG